VDTTLPEADADVRALFGPLREGAALGSGFRIETVHGIRGGAIPVVLATASGDRFAVEVFRADPEGPTPIARAGELALHLINRGSGESPTDERAGLAVMALARALEDRVARGAPLPAGLETHRARMANDPFRHGSYALPLG
jgi:hypothetical protein